MSEEKKTPEATVTTPEKTFTQAEVDELIKARLWRETSKYSDYDELKAKAAKFDEQEDANKTELQKAQEKVTALETQVNEMTRERDIANARSKVAKEKGIPVDMLYGEDEATCIEQADKILAYMKQTGSRPVPDGGETHNAGAGTNADKFARWLSDSLG